MDMQKINAAWLRRISREISSLRPGYDVMTISFPKSGRTWHRLMVGNYLARALDIPIRKSLNLDVLCRRAGVSPLCYSHNGSNFLDWLNPDDPVVASPDLWRGKKVILLIRDPRDILVSAFHHAKYRAHSFDGDMSEFIHERRIGLEKILTAYRRWLDDRQQAAEFTVQSYEKMHADPRHVLDATLKIIGVSEPSLPLLEETVQFCSFQNMQAMEQEGFFESPKLSNPGSDKNSAKVRSGKIAGYVGQISAVDLTWIDNMMRQYDNPFVQLQSLT